MILHQLLDSIVKLLLFTGVFRVLVNVLYQLSNTEVRLLFVVIIFKTLSFPIVEEFVINTIKW